MKTKRAKFSWRMLPFAISAPVVAGLVCAPSFGLMFPGWAFASLEALGALALIGAVTTGGDERGLL
jgi:hypothetical protein